MYVNGSTCATTCSYAYKLGTDVHGNSGAKICVSTCGAGQYLSNSSGIPFCTTGCLGTFYFINGLGDKECLPTTVTTSTGCGTFATRRDGTVSDKLYFTDGDDNLKVCQVNCASAVYMAANK
jgi:hypothetical protein